MVPVQGLQCDCVAITPSEFNSSYNRGALVQPQTTFSEETPDQQNSTTVELWMSEMNVLRPDFIRPWPKRGTNKVISGLWHLGTRRVMSNWTWSSPVEHKPFLQNINFIEGRRWQYDYDGSRPKQGHALIIPKYRMNLNVVQTTKRMQTVPYPM